jgi:O-antigen ligase
MTCFFYKVMPVLIFNCSANCVQGNRYSAANAARGLSADCKRCDLFTNAIIERTTAQAIERSVESMKQATGVLAEQMTHSTGAMQSKLQAFTPGVAVGAVFAFLAATIVSVWAAYDGAVALNRFFLLLPGALAILVAPLLGSRLSAGATSVSLTLLSSFLVIGTAALYLAAHMVGISPWLPALSDNQAAQILAIALPVTMAAIWLGISERRRFVSAVGLVALLVGTVALALTGSRGAWLGIAAGMLAALFLGVRTVQRQRARRRTPVIWLFDTIAVLALLGGLGIYVAVVLSPALDAQLGVSARGGSAFSRIALWRDSIPLIQDYFFTGSGLGATAMIYATYAYLLHVPYLYHAHNFYVQIALEQGVPALLAWMGLIVATSVYAFGALRNADYAGRVILIASFASLTAFLVHGLFEAELYFGALAGLVFFPPTLLLWSAASVYGQAAELEDDGSDSGVVTGIGVIVGVGLPLLLAVLLPGAPARWEANLGAVLQTRTELGLYHWPEWSFQDQVRVVQPQLLAPAEALFITALKIDPTQPTAHRRLGAILLARGEFDRARDHLTAAYALAPYDRATRQLLGEVLALEGDITGAVQTWRGLDVSQGQFMVREWWYQAFGRPEQVEKLNNAVQAFRQAE